MNLAALKINSPPKRPYTTTNAGTNPPWLSSPLPSKTWRQAPGRDVHRQFGKHFIGEKGGEWSSFWKLMLQEMRILLRHQGWLRNTHHLPFVALLPNHKEKGNEKISIINVDLQ